MRLVPDPGTDVPTNPVADGGNSWLDTLAGLLGRSANHRTSVKGGRA